MVRDDGAGRLGQPLRRSCRDLGDHVDDRPVVGRELGTAGDGRDPGLLRIVEDGEPDPGGHGIVIHGGAKELGTGEAFFADTWLLQHGNAEPRELCLIAADNDGDELVGCADPDCWTRCTPACPPGGPSPSFFQRCTGCPPSRTPALPGRNRSAVRRDWRRPTPSARRCGARTPASR